MRLTVTDYTHAFDTPKNSIFRRGSHQFLSSHRIHGFCRCPLYFGPINIDLPFCISKASVEAIL
jgi:hypothetical protein